MPPPLTRLTLYVKDAKGVARFYGRHFGYSAHPKPGGLIELHPPGDGIHLLLHPLAKGRKAGQTLVKLAFYVKDVETAKATFAAQGLDFGPTHQGDGYQFSDSRDPAGNAISITSRVFTPEPVA